MNETLKQNRLLREQGDNRSYPSSSDGKRSCQGLGKNVSDFHHLGDHAESSGGRSSLYAFKKEHLSSQKAMALPSSPHEHRSQTSGTSGAPDEMMTMWNKILESQMLKNKLLFPFPEWNFDFAELTVGSRIGMGCFGEVFCGVWNGTKVAIKVFLQQDLTAGNMEYFCNEISILSRLRHPNVILFLGACMKPPHLSMVTEYMEQGSLYNFIHERSQKKKLDLGKKIKMLCDICRGLMCMHRMKIVHRDLKSANCLVNKHLTVKICDFGLSKMTEPAIKRSSPAGTPQWMAPELMRNKPFTEKCDIFSLGVIMWELCTLSKPWLGVPRQRIIFIVGHEDALLKIPEGPLSGLIADCWAEPQKRPSCEEILSRLEKLEYELS